MAQAWYESLEGVVASPALSHAAPQFGRSAISDFADPRSGVEFSKDARALVQTAFVHWIDPVAGAERMSAATVAVLNKDGSVEIF